MVRPPEPAFPWRPRQPSEELLSQLPDLMAEQLREAQKMRIDPDAYVAALRDWVTRGGDSRYALSEEEVMRRSQPRTEERSRAAACFELGQHLQRTGHPGDATTWFARAQRLDPGNWTYKRQSWSLADPLQGPTDVYDSDWLTEVRALGAENYYPPVEL